MYKLLLVRIFGKEYFSKKSIAEDDGLFQPVDFTTSYLFKTGSVIDTKKTKGQYNAYLNCPPISILITAKATAANNGQWYFGAEDKVLRSNQTLKLYQDLIEKPNEYQSFDEFFSEGYQANQLFGVAYIHVIRPAGMKRRYATSMYVLKNTSLSVIIDQKTKQILKYTVNDGNSVYDIPADEVMIWNDFTVSFDLTVKPNLAQSRLYSLSNPVNTIIAAYQANNKMLTNYGMLGILSPDGNNGGVPNKLTPKEKSDIQSHIQNDYGLLADQWPIALADKPMQYTSVMRPVKDLDLQNTINDSTIVIAEAYRYPPTLLGVSKTSTYNNVNDAGKALYTKAIIPELENFASTFNQYFNLSSDNKLRCSFTEVPELQADKKYEAEVYRTVADTYSKLYNENIITKDALAELLSLDDSLIKPDPASMKQDSILVERIGVEGTQAMIEIITSEIMTEAQKISSLQILFGMELSVAQQMIRG